MTDNTPLNADDELRRIFDDDVFEIEVDGRRMNVVPFYTAVRTVEKYVLADRKKHELQAVLKELKWAKTASVWNIEVRISELEKELERL